MEKISVNYPTYVLDGEAEGLVGIIKWNYGLTENLDLGLHWESLSIGIRAKYAFINNKAGWSLATALGTGASIGGSHYMATLSAVIWLARGSHIVL